MQLHAGKRVNLHPKKRHVCKILQNNEQKDTAALSHTEDISVEADEAKPGLLRFILILCMGGSDE